MLPLIFMVLGILKLALVLKLLALGLGLLQRVLEGTIFIMPILLIVLIK